jgi:Domain of unknown function (DUF3854)
MDDRTWARMQRVLRDERGVSREVASERGYRPFDRGDTWVRELFPDMSNPQWGATFGRLVKLTSGIVIPKHPVPGTRAIAPQLRPDKAVELWAPDRHDHESYGPTARQRHEAGKKHNEASVRVEGEHVHPHDPKYLLAPLPVIDVSFSHTHNNRTSEAHRAKPHDEPEGIHSHVKRGKDRERSAEKRLDVHPRSWQMMEDPDRRVFFSIEGTIKADAMLSQDEATVAVPSVAMWTAEELEDFTRETLAGRRVYVVPDADWAHKPEVALQAFACANALRRFGATAAVAAVPEESGLKGVDDFLAAGGSVEDLTVVRREVSSAMLEFMKEVLGDRYFGDRRFRKTVIRVLEFIATHADEQGRCVKMGKTVAGYTDLSLKRLDAVVGALTFGDDRWDGWVPGGNWPQEDTEPPFVYREFSRWERGTEHRWGEFDLRADLRSRTMRRPLKQDQ